MYTLVYWTILDEMQLNHGRRDREWNCLKTMEVEITVFVVHIINHSPKYEVYGGIAISGYLKGSLTYPTHSRSQVAWN